MKRIFLLLSLALFAGCIYFLYDSSMELNKYSDSRELKKKIEITDKEIKDIEDKISKKESEIAKFKVEKSEDVELLEVWKKEAEKVSKNS